MFSPRNICASLINVIMLLPTDHDQLNKACALTDHGLLLTKQILIRERLADEYLATSLHISV